MNKFPDINIIVNTIHLLDMVKCFKIWKLTYGFKKTRMSISGFVTYYNMYMNAILKLENTNNI